MEFNQLVKEKELQIFDFLFWWGRPIRVGDLSDKLEIKHSTINSVLKRLEKDGFIEWEKYGLVSLSEKGQQEAGHYANHHFIVEKFLKETLDLTEQQAHNHAIELAGRVNCDLIDAICSKLKISHTEINTEYCDHRKYSYQS
jgi:Mn-dependent DtxR family transcriptional regulator